MVCLLIICITILTFTLLTRQTLYEVAETIYMVTKNRDALLREAARLDQSSFVVKRAIPMLKTLRARQFEF
ncbi:Hok/Gef family protein [Escherichia coli]